MRSSKGIANLLNFLHDFPENSHGQPVSTPPFLDIGPVNWGEKKQKHLNPKEMLIYLTPDVKRGTVV